VRFVVLVLLLALGCDRARTADRSIPETERSAPIHLAVRGHVVLPDVRDLSERYVVDRDRVLWRRDGDHRRRITDRVRRVPVEHPAGLVVVRESHQLGASDLWLVGASSRALSPAPGSDDMPYVLPDGRVVFVSTRTTVASVWIFDDLDAPPRQLTNVGLRAGRPLVGFVPTPSVGFAVERGHLVYDGIDLGPTEDL
jgi:hypothetical protein